MHKITNTPCRKCGGNTSIYWEEPEKSSGMDIRPLKKGGMKKSCHNCGFEEDIASLDDENVDLATLDKKSS